ncbi:MAG: hypothetical protein HFG26_10630 [Provencibacterium sp.]|nr:hypothetical protein [Provencibacterium sp.]
MVLYYYFACPDPQEYAANLQAFFCLTSVYSLFLHALHGNLTGETLRYAGAGLLVLLPCALLGGRLLRKISHASVGIGIYLLIGIMGLVQIISALCS